MQSDTTEMTHFQSTPIIIPNFNYFSVLAYYFAFVFFNTDVFNHMIGFLA